MPKPGRPRAKNLNRFAVEHELRRLGRTKSWLAAEVGLSTSHLSEALGDTRKGIDDETVREMALILGCPVEMIAPELTGYFVCIRPGDTVEAVPA